MKTLFTLIIIFTVSIRLNAQEIEKFLSFEKQFIAGTITEGDEVLQTIYDSQTRILSFALKIKDYKIELEKIGYKFYSFNRQRNFDTYINCEKKIILTLQPQWNGTILFSLLKSTESYRITPLLNGCK